MLKNVRFNLSGNSENQEIMISIFKHNVYYLYNILFVNLDSYNKILSLIIEIYFTISSDRFMFQKTFYKKKFQPPFNLLTYRSTPCKFLNCKRV